MSSSKLDASVIILTKDGGDNLGHLLEIIFAQQFDGKFEVLVIDSGSKDSTLRTAKEFPVIIKEINPNDFHHGKTRNLGGELAKGSVLVYITQDALPLRNDWLLKLTRNFEDNNVAMVCGRQIPWETTKPPEKFFYIYNFPQFRVEIKRGASDYYHDNIFISNANSAIRRNVWQKLGFSESVIMAEDKEFAKRVLSDGWTIVYEPEAAVYHAHHFGLREIFCRYADYGISARQGAAGLARSRGWLARKVIYYSIDEVKYLARSGNLKWLPYSVIYDMNRYLGTLWGQALWVGGKRKP